VADKFIGNKFDENQLQGLRDKIVNKALVIGFFFGFISYSVTFMRALEYGLDWTFISISVVIVYLALVVFFRRKLSLNVKIYTIMGVVLIALVSGLVKYGFLVSSKAYLILIPILVSFILEYKKALILLFVYTSVYVLFGVLFMMHLIPFEIDANDYILSPSAWLMDISIIMLTALALLLVGKMYSATILEKLDVIKENSKDLEIREKRYRSLFEHSFDAVMILKDGLFYQANEKAVEMFGGTMDYVIGNSPKNTSPEYQSDGEKSSEKAARKIAKALAGEPQLFEWKHKKQNGELFDASISLVLIQYEGQEYLQAILHDITLRKKRQAQIEEYKEHLESLVMLRTQELEAVNKDLIATNKSLEIQRNELENTVRKLHETQEKLIESEKMASLGLLTAGVAHEINNPLNYIQGGVYGLQNNLEIIYSKIHDKIEEGDLAINTEMFEGIEEGVRRITNIVNSLNHFSRYNENVHDICCLVDIVNNCLNILHHQIKNKVDVEVKQMGTDLCIQGYEGSLHQIFLNLILNAYQAIEGKVGRILIVLKKSEDNKKAIVKIEDNGSGMTESVMSKIFDPFFTTKEPGVGTGLGLSIVYKAVEKHKGKISVESQIGEGTKFILEFPMKQKELNKLN